MSSPRGATLILAGVLLFAGLQLILLRYLFNLDDVILNNFISDSAIYQQMVDAFRGVAAPVTRSPFGSRILTPLLASILPAGSSEALFIVNLASGLLTLSLLHSFGVAHVGLTRRNASLAALAHATSIPYLTYGCLDLIDLTTYLFVILFLRVYLGGPRRWWALLLVLMVGFIQKESILIFVPFLLLNSRTLNPQPRTDPALLAMLVLFFAAAGIYLHLLGQEIFWRNFSLEQHLHHIWYRLMENPLFVGRTAAATFGLLWIPFLASPGRIWQRGWQRSLFISTMLLVTYAFFYAAFQTKYVFTAFPLVIPLALLRLQEEERRGPWVAPLLVGTSAALNYLALYLRYSFLL